MAESAELAFVKQHLVNISSIPVQYPNDYQQPPENSLKKVSVLPIELPAPPAPKEYTEASTSDSVKLTFKSSKPPKTYTLTVNPKDSIASIKDKLATQPGAAPADTQRLLLRGKALADSKILIEYGVKEEDVINLMLKPGVNWDWNAAGSISVPMEVDSGLSTPQRRVGHGRIPSVVLSPSPTGTSMPAPGPIVLTLDTAIIPTASELSSAEETYHRKVSSPEFWEKLYIFLRAEFESSDDASRAFEGFLLGSKGSLSPSEIAKIRDRVGVMGMAGT